MKISARSFAKYVPTMLGAVMSFSACSDATNTPSATGGTPSTTGGSTNASGGATMGGANTSGGSVATGGSMGGSVMGGATSGGSLATGGSAGSAGASQGGGGGATSGGSAGSSSGGSAGSSGSAGMAGNSGGAGGNAGGGKSGGGGASGSAGSAGTVQAGGGAGGASGGGTAGGGGAGGSAGGAGGACGSISKATNGSYTRTGWTAVYTCTGACPAKNGADTDDVETNAFDNDYGTRWSTGVYQSALSQQNKFPLFFTVDMKQATTVSKLTTHPGCQDNKDSPGTVEVQLSMDGTTFTTVTAAPHTPAMVPGEVCPPNASSVATDTITFPATCARYIRLKGTRRTSPDVYWAIGEMFVYP